MSRWGVGGIVVSGALGMGGLRFKYDKVVSGSGDIGVSE